MIYWQKSVAEGVVIVTAGGVCTLISGLWQWLSPLIWALRYDASCIWNGQTLGALCMDQNAGYMCKRRAGSKLWNATCCESISCSTTLEDNLVVLEHRYVAKQYLIHNLRGTHKRDLGRGMLKQWPTLDMTLSNRYQVQVQLDKVESHFIESVRDNIAVLYILHLFKSDAEHLKFVNPLLADNQYRFTSPEPVEGGKRSPNMMQRESKAGNTWPASTLFPGGSNPVVYLQQILSFCE